MVALAASPGNLADDAGTLRSSDVKPQWNLRRCSAAQSFFVPVTCGSTAGYLTPQLRSESHADPPFNGYTSFNLEFVSRQNGPVEPASSGS